MTRTCWPSLVATVLPTLFLHGCGSEPGGCDSPVPEVTVQIHVTAVFEESSGQPVVGEAATIDVYKVTCSGETKRAVGTPMQGKTDNQGRFVGPMVIGYNVHDEKDAVFVDASSACGSMHRRYSPDELRAQASFPLWELAVEPCDPAPTPLQVDSPADGDRLVVDRTVQFRGTTGCKNATLTLVADGKYPMGTLSNVSGAFSHEVKFNTPGKDRTVEISVKDSQGCSGSRTLTLTVQPALGHTVETLVQTINSTTTCSYELHSVTVPLAHPDLEVAGVGADPRVKVSALAATHPKARVTINGGFFDGDKGPLSFARGHLGYVSTSDNRRGPRACLVIDRPAREAKIELSMGCQLSGTTCGTLLYPATTDVVCGGPRLLESGASVAAAHIISENIDASSGIKPDEAVPRTAACIRDDGALTLFVAQPTTSTTCGPKLVPLADLLLARGCVDALNLDGGGSSALWYSNPSTLYFPGNEDRPVYQGLLVYGDP